MAAGSNGLDLVLPSTLYCFRAFRYFVDKFLKSEIVYCSPQKKRKIRK